MIIRPIAILLAVLCLAVSAGAAQTMRLDYYHTGDASQEVFSVDRDLVESGTPIPTPWNKEAFEAYSREIKKRRVQLRKDKRPEEEMEALFKEELEHEQKMFGAEKYFGKVGAFEGAMYEARGYYRPEVDCIMFSRTNHFCRVCQQAIEHIIKMYSRQI
jgi:hypothetical protein